MFRVILLNFFVVFVFFVVQSLRLIILQEERTC